MYPSTLPPGTRTTEIRGLGICFVFPDGAKRVPHSGWYEGENYTETMAGKRSPKPQIINIVPPEMFDWDHPDLALLTERLVDP
jgi:hypothetical protein